MKSMLRVGWLQAELLTEGTHPKLMPAVTIFPIAIRRRCLRPLNSVYLWTIALSWSLFVALRIGPACY